MTEQQYTIKRTDRRTYLVGHFNGQFQGRLDANKSDYHRVQYYDIEILRGFLKVDGKDIRHYEVGEEDKFRDEQLSITVFPDPLPTSVTNKGGRVSHYNLNFNEVKIKDYRLYHQIHDGKRVYGDISGELSGYLYHYEEEHVPVEQDVTTHGPSTTLLKDKKAVTEIKSGRGTSTELSPSSPPNAPPSSHGLGSDSTFYQEKENWNWLRILLVLLLLLLASWAVYIFSWQALIPIALLAAAVLLMTFAVGSALASLLLWFFRLAFLLLLVGIGVANYLDWQNNREELTNGKSTDAAGTPEAIEFRLVRDSLISHTVSWEDYAGTAYTTQLNIRSSTFTQAREFREGLHVGNRSESAYRAMMQAFYLNDNERLTPVYSALDSIRASHQLSPAHFAEVVVSLVQSLPYVLLLPETCDAGSYSDPFIHEYLDGAGPCQGQVKFGVHTPSEFVATLQGDCDTRTLFIYTILQHFNYRVAILGSTYWNHSLLAVDLPYAGASITVNGRRFVLWETTEPGQYPGRISTAQTDMSNWTITLLSEIILQ